MMLDLVNTLSGIRPLRDLFWRVADAGLILLAVLLALLFTPCRRVLRPAHWRRS